MDAAANDMSGDRDISATGAAVRTLVIAAREDLQIAHEVRELLGASVRRAPPGA